MASELVPNARWGRPASINRVRAAWEEIAQEVLDHKAWRIAHYGVCWAGVARDLHSRFEIMEWREALTRLMGEGDLIVEELVTLLEEGRPREAGKRLEEHLGVSLG